MTPEKKPLLNILWDFLYQHKESSLEKLIELCETEKNKPTELIMYQGYPGDEYLFSDDTKKEIEQKVKSNINSLRYLEIAHKITYLNGSSSYDLTTFGIKAHNKI